MKKFKKVVSLVSAVTLLTSSVGATLSVAAANIFQDNASAAAADYALADSVKDGVMLHAFNWSYNSIKENLPAIAAAGYTTVQTSPVQQPKDFTSSSDVSGQWWKLYQPVSMSIAQKSWLGKKADLQSLCEEADKYGIKIICDIVSNHMGNETESDPSSLSPQVQEYQPDFFENKDTYFHSYTGSADSDASLQKIVQGHVSACPDINTGNTDVQNAVISLLKECIDCGVDGFRFDAAKHIETPDDGAYASDYWPNITSAASDYYNQKTGEDLYIYGEILNTCGTGRSYKSYANYINYTDNTTGDLVLAGIKNGSASSAARSKYIANSDASNVVLWAESHDTYEGSTGATSKVSNENIIKAWAMVAARQDATALYFARPGSALMGEAATDTAYKSTAVAEINKFHNAFAGQSEKVGYNGDVSYVARGTSGIVLVNCAGTDAEVEIADTGLADGTYTDTITGNQFTASGGTLTGSIGSTGVAVVYTASTTPRNICSVESGEFYGDTMTVTIGLENAYFGTCCLNDSMPFEFTDEITIRIGSDYAYGETINLTLTAADGKKYTRTTYKYTKREPSSSGVYVWFNAANKRWAAPYSVYIYDENSSDEMTYSNANWPGEAMSYDEKTGYYYYEVPSKLCLGRDNASDEVAETEFDLAHSANTNVIVVGSGANQQYPGPGARTKIKLEGTSHIYALTATNSWAVTDLVPSADTSVEATDVTRFYPPPPETTVPDITLPDITVPETTVPETTLPETTVPETTVPETTVPEILGIYGDADTDDEITIKDATEIQKMTVRLIKPTSLQTALSDVNGDGVVSISDVTVIQKYLAKLGYNTGKVGTPCMK